MSIQEEFEELKDTDKENRERILKSVKSKPIDLKTYAGQFAQNMIENLVLIANDMEVSAHTRMAACNSVLDRGCGKPSQYVEVIGGTKDDLSRESTEELIKRAEKLNEAIRTANT